MKAWALKKPDGKLALWTIARTRRACINDATLFSAAGVPIEHRWRCVRVEIREVET